MFDQRHPLHAQSRLATIASWTVVLISTMVFVLTVVTFCSGLQGLNLGAIGIRYTPHPQLTVTELGDMAWYGAITLFTLVLIWTGIRSLRARIPMVGLGSALVLATLLIDTNVDVVVCPLLLVSVVFLAYVGYFATPQPDIAANHALDRSDA
jgi:hypothetical protein